MRVVRVVMTTARAEPITEFLEQLRYAGHVRIHKDDNEGVVFDILPPGGVDDYTWAEMNAERMRSFMYSAVSAPEWAGEFTIRP